MQNYQNYNDENKRFHLQMLQDTISRMASNTFLIKGWSITALGAIYTFWITSKSYKILMLIFGLTVFFWFHDTYYLKLERGFRNKYNEVRFKDSKDIDFDINPINKDSFLCVMVRPILLFSYGTLLIINIVLLFTYVRLYN